MEKGSYLYNGAYAKGSQAKHAALDWFSSMTAATNENSHWSYVLIFKFKFNFMN